MKKFALLLTAAFCFAAATQGGLVLVDSFETYADGQSLADAGAWQNISNHGSNAWLQDPGNIHAKNDGGNMVLSITDDDLQSTGDLLLGNSGAVLDIPDITDKGTIYMRLKLSDDSVMSITTNGLGAIENQGVHNWGGQASIAQFPYGTQTGGTYAFRGRDTVGGTNNYYNSPTSTVDSETWLEFWIQLDVSTDTSRYFMRPLGSTDAPTAMLDPDGTDIWSFRSTIPDHTIITSLKFNIEPSPNWACTVSGEAGKEDCVFYENLVDSIAVDTSAWTLDSVPEPASLSLLALGGLLAIRRR